MCSEIKVDQPDQICRKSTLSILHKIIWNKSPPQIFNIIKCNNKHIACSKLGLINPPIKQNSKRTAVFVGMELFNNLPLGLKVMHPKKKGWCDPRWSNQGICNRSNLASSARANLLQKVAWRSSNLNNEGQASLKTQNHLELRKLRTQRRNPNAIHVNKIKWFAIAQI